MCMTTKEMDETMEAIQEWKRIKEQTEDNISALNMKVIDYLKETDECEAVDKKGTRSANLSEPVEKPHYPYRSVRALTKRKSKSC